MPRRAWTSYPATKVLTTASRSASGEDPVEKGVSRWRFLSVLFLVGVGFFTIGFLLVILGYASSASSGGCFFWPFPVIVACGLGSRGGSFLLIGVLTIVATFLVLLLGWWTRKPGAQSSPGRAGEAPQILLRIFSLPKS